MDCVKFPDILRVIFDKMLNNGMSVAKKRITEVTQNDDRMENLSKRLKVIQIQYNFLLIINRITRLTVVIGKFIAYSHN